MRYAEKVAKNRCFLQGLNGGGSPPFLWALSIVYDTLRNPILPLYGGFVTATISFSEKQGIATLTFDNPSRRNALGAAELDAIERALGALSAETRVLVVTSSDDRIFCAGADVTQILDGSLKGNRFQ